ncbi:MAG: hypothetical protein MHM6MM_001604 [Cercozoa sp. M6MM]
MPEYRDVQYSQLDKRKFYTVLPASTVGLRTILYPLSLVRTRLQTSDAGEYRNAWHCFRTVLRNEGFRGLYKGLFVNLSSSAITPIYVTTLEMTRQVYTRTLSNLYDAPALTSSAGAVMAGASASAVSQCFIVPLDVVSQRRMIETGHNTPSAAHRYSGPERSSLRIARDVVQQCGWRGLWRGYAVSLCTYAPTSATVWGTFSLYRSLIHSVIDEPHDHSNRNSSDLSDSAADEHENDVGVLVSAASLAGVTGAIATNPVDVVRARLQVDDRAHVSVRDTVRELVANEGWRGFTRGLSARVTQMSIQVPVMLTCYELLKRWCAVGATK